MKTPHLVFLLLAFLAFTTCESFSLSSPIKSVESSVCVEQLKTQGDLLDSLIKDLAKKNYKRVVEKIGDLNHYFNETISKCADEFCWMNGQQRCEYTTEQSCELINGLWYPQCKTGYKVKEQSICVQQCPQSFKESGLLYCEKPDSYSRGLGYPWKFSDRLGSLDGARERCAKENTQGCEQLGAIIYPKCANNFHSSGCCQCKPDCPLDMKDNGVTCQRKQYARGFGHTDGQCIANEWSQFNNIDSYGECVDQLAQLQIEFTDLQENFNLQDANWDILKKAYTLTKHSSPFLESCSEAVNALPSSSDNSEDTSQNIDVLTQLFELLFKIVQWVIDVFFKKE